MNIIEQMLMSYGYQIISKIEPGGNMADVYRGDQDLGAAGMRPVVVKVLKPQPFATGLPDPRQNQSFRLFLQEASLVAGITHPHIITLLEYQYDEETQQAFIVTPYMEGGTLLNQLEQADGQPLPPDQVMHWLLHITDGLAYIHHKNILHLDIKPPNILLDSVVYGSRWKSKKT
jgi:serine/threonine protein kinase